MKLYIVLADRKDEALIDKALKLAKVPQDNITFFAREKEPFISTSAHIGTLASAARTLVMKGNAVVVVSECDPYRRPEDWVSTFSEGMRNLIGVLIEPVAYDKELSYAELVRIVMFALKVRR